MNPELIKDKKDGVSKIFIALSISKEMKLNLN